VERLVAGFELAQVDTLPEKESGDESPQSKAYCTGRPGSWISFQEGASWGNTKSSDFSLNSFRKNGGIGALHDEAKMGVFFSANSLRADSIDTSFPSTVWMVTFLSDTLLRVRSLYELPSKPM